MGIKEWAQNDLDRALSYYQSLGWCPKTGSYIGDMKCLITTLKNVHINRVKILDGFMKNKELLAFLIVHSVFEVDARTDGDFIELYMSDRISVSDNQVVKLYSKKIPDEILSKIAVFDPEPVMLQTQPYRVEFGCRKDVETGRYHRDPIRVTSTIIEHEESVVSAKDFLSKFGDIVL